MLTGWREATGSRIWRIDLQPGESNLPSMPNNENMATLISYSAYDLPSIAALIRYSHAAVGYPFWSTWFKKIGAGNYSLWPGITIANATKYFPYADATIMGNLVQKHQGVRSTKPKPPKTFHLRRQSPVYDQTNSFFKSYPLVNYTLTTQVALI